MFLLAFTSADIISDNILELHSTLTDKKIFFTNFPFLTDSFNPPVLPSLPLEQPKSVKRDKFFVDVSLAARGMGNHMHNFC